MGRFRSRSGLPGPRLWGGLPRLGDITFGRAESKGVEKRPGRTNRRRGLGRSAPDAVRAARSSHRPCARRHAATGSQRQPHAAVPGRGCHWLRVAFSAAELRATNFRSSRSAIITKASGSTGPINSPSGRNRSATLAQSRPGIRRRIVSVSRRVGLFQTS